MTDCQWDGCCKKASHNVFNSSGKDSALLCTFHRQVALINLEQHDLVFSPNTHGKSPRRPGDLGNIDNSRTRPGNKPGWEQTAAQKAIENTVPFDDFKLDRLTKIDDIPAPRRKRGEQGLALRSVVTFVRPLSVRYRSSVATTTFGISMSQVLSLIHTRSRG